MNADIVHLLCNHLDLSTLLCFAAAYPKWSAIVYRHFNKKPNIRLQVKFTKRGCSVGYRRFAKLPEEWPNLAAGQRKVLEKFPQCVWEQIPCAAIDVAVVSVKQYDYVLVYPELYVPLTKIKTKVLNLRFSQRNLAREVLQAISFHPKSVLLLNETSTRGDKESILRKDQLRNFKKVQYHGRMEMLTNDLLMALDSHCVELSILAHTSTDVESWATSTLQKYVTEHSSGVQCIEDEPLKYKIKRIGDGNAKDRKNGARKICVYDFFSSPFDFIKLNDVKFSIEP